MITGIGEKVKKIRNEKKITLRELSERTGLSTSFLSQFERGQSTIAVDSLMNVAEALETDISFFIDSTTKSGSGPSGHVMPLHRRMWHVTSDNQLQCYLSPEDEDLDMFARQITLLPNSGDEKPTTYRHDGEEFIYVTEGVLTLVLNGETFRLTPGDAAQFRSADEHIWYNDTNRNVSFLIVNYPNYLKEKNK
jgi:transcriptional regulator with XRE-family HTH domain